ncbi:LytR family transcriptional regulator [Mobiluncus mulieris]|uniref:LytR family transcriptional regulator n=1 Tax=Mobiluncus mulieris TaxID=2052 RepID=A0ABD4TWP6_9ACTO|nr:LCP family protein [Mobiluncus mulieris]MCU9968657.1 LytR family transcriptional regulator [Mobiluncus mulieris]MCU9973143.1 LytR family transcriptional regulator [Mobiluncus mulieris]MCV0008707.1 LytR family transcriptional regulator [Mobiluncus mulieris]NMX00656.1 LytR family transcriptional regulator [Mobiluncus mulieris]NMX19522.1 LytR family transcriptional regulator [Mobiluncus mulieris]
MGLPERANHTQPVYNSQVITKRHPIASHALALPPARHPWRILVSIVVFLVVFGLSFVTMVMADVSSWAKKVDISSMLGTEHRKEKPKDPQDSFANRDLNVLVIGTDYRAHKEYDERGQLVVGMRSDTTLLAHISANRQRIEIMSIPRDLMVDRPECSYQDGHTEPASLRKVQFNSVFSLLSQDKFIAPGTACTIKAVEKLTGVYIDQFVVVDFDGFQNMVAALGGVPMCFENPLKDRLAGLDVPAGCHTLDPVQALAFARARKGIGDGSDIGRIGRQQQLVGAMMKEAKSRNLLTDLPSLYAFLKAGMKSLTTSEEFGSATNMGGLAVSLAKIKPENIRFYTLPFGEYPPDPARVAVADNADEMFKALRADTPIPSIFPYQDLDGKQVEDTPEASADPDASNSSRTSGDSDESSVESGQSTSLSDTGDLTSRHNGSDTSINRYDSGTSRGSR